MEGVTSVNAEGNNTLTCIVGTWKDDSWIKRTVELYVKGMWTVLNNFCLVTGL